MSSGPIWFGERTPESDVLQREAMELLDWVRDSAQLGQPPCAVRIRIETINNYGPSGPKTQFVVSVDAPCREVWIGPRVETWHGKDVRWSLRNSAPRPAGEPLGHYAPRGFGGPAIPFNSIEQLDELEELSEAGYFDEPGSRE